MQKYRDSDIKPFEFADLKGSHVVSGSQFQPFSFNQLNGESVTSTKASEEEIRSERTFARQNNFKIDDLVSDYRGLSRQEQADLEQKIQSEVERRLQASYQDAYKEGLEKGRAEGKAEALAQHEGELAQTLESFTSVLTELQAQSNAILQSSRQEIYEFIKRFTKWIILKEVDEKVYLQQLLEKLILELNARKNLIVKVGRANFAQMPEIISAVEARLGSLQNLRVEIIPDIQHPGIILESENGLIDGSMEGVFRNIDAIFEQVTAHE